MAEITITTIFYAVIGGIVPGLIWLFFWIGEDCHPEPKSLLFLAFLGGALAIPVALTLAAFYDRVSDFDVQNFAVAGMGAIAILALFEETAKYFVTKFLIFWRKDFDEPVDAMIYLMTAALGFASVENILYLIPDFAQSTVMGIGTGNLRFIGATLLHALASGVLGFFVAHQFCHGKLHKAIGATIGIAAATAAHTLFNVVMLRPGEEDVRLILLLLGTVGFFMLMAFEHIKARHQTCPIHSATHAVS